MHNLLTRLSAKYVSLADYVLPVIPNELKHAKTQREMRYLEIINELMTTVKQDPMTGLQHKEHFRTKTRGRGVFILVDGDGLKKLNDTYGHEVGHAAILALSEGIKSVLRAKDKATIVAPKMDAMRSGGDEFVIHIEDVTMSGGVAIAKRMLDSIHNQKISKHYKGKDKDILNALDHIMLKASFGVGYTEEDADKAMYKAKEKGRDRVEFYKKYKDEDGEASSP
jgi:diguanylate cyclase (GGDEF)-like protein